MAQASGTVEERYSYRGYGAATYFSSLWVPRSVSALGARHTFSGREEDVTSKLLFYRTRYIHPATGTFVQRDILGCVGGPNLYAYVSGNPLSRVDPFGLIDPGSGPPIPGGPHIPGGPWEPAINTRCSDADPCAVLLEKIRAKMMQIASHINWDKAHPDPAHPRGRHADEINDLKNGLSRCFEIYERMCRNEKKPPRKPNPRPRTCHELYESCMFEAKANYDQCTGVFCEVIYAFTVSGCGQGLSGCNQGAVNRALGELIAQHPLETIVVVAVVICAVEFIVPAVVAGELGLIPAGGAALAF